MSSSTTKKCDVCGKEEKEPRAGSPWARLTIGSGWYGPHPYLTGPHASQHDGAGRDDDVCSAECALKWLEKRIERVKANAKDWADWNAGAPAREEALRRSREEEERRRREAQPPPVPELGTPRR